MMVIESWEIKLSREVNMTDINGAVQLQAKDLLKVKAQ